MLFVTVVLAIIVVVVVFVVVVVCNRYDQGWIHGHQSTDGLTEGPTDGHILL